MIRDDDKDLEVVLGVLARRVEREPEISAVHAFQRVQAALTVGERTSSSPIFRRKWTIGLAAGLCLLALAGTGYFFNIVRKENTTSDSRTYTTAQGQSARITLSDGSVVNLAPGSSLSADITSAKRELALSGEALFAVSASNHSPFIVKAGNTTTRVLGTSFGVRKYPEDASVRVAVAEGKVVLDNVVLAIGDVGLAKPGRPVDVRSDINVTDMLGWTNGRLILRDVPMRNVVPVLLRWYGIEIQIADSSLMNTPFTTTMSTNARPSTVIEVLSATLNVRAERKGRVVTLFRKNS